MKQRIRLTESDLHRMIKKTVNKVLKENENLNYVPDDWYEEDDEALNNNPRLMFAEMYDVFDDASEVLEILLKYASDDEIRQWCNYLIQEQDKLISKKTDNNTGIWGNSYGIRTK